MPIDIGRLTPEQTAELLCECISALPDELLFPALEKALTPEQKDELGEVWYHPN